MRTTWWFGVLALWMIQPAGAVEQAQSVTAVRSARAIMLDGRLDEAVWAKARPIDHYYET